MNSTLITAILAHKVRTTWLVGPRLDSVSKRLRLVQAMMLETEVVAIIVALRFAMAVAVVPGLDPATAVAAAAALKVWLRLAIAAAAALE